MASNGNDIFNISLTFHGEPAGMSARLSHVGTLSLDELAVTVELLEKLVHVGRDYVRAVTPKAPEPKPEHRAEPAARSIPRDMPADDAPGLRPIISEREKARNISNLAERKPNR